MRFHTATLIAAALAAVPAAGASIFAANDAGGPRLAVTHAGPP